MRPRRPPGAERRRSPMDDGCCDAPGFCAPSADSSASRNCDALTGFVQTHHDPALVQTVAVAGDVHERRHHHHGNGVERRHVVNHPGQLQPVDIRHVEVQDGSNRTDVPPTRCDSATRRAHRPPPPRSCPWRPTTRAGDERPCGWSRCRRRRARDGQESALIGSRGCASPRCRSSVTVNQNVVAVPGSMAVKRPRRRRASTRSSWKPDSSGATPVARCAWAATATSFRQASARFPRPTAISSTGRDRTAARTLRAPPWWQRRQ